MLYVTSSISWRYGHEGDIYNNAYQQTLSMGTRKDLPLGTLRMFAVQHLLLCRGFQFFAFGIYNLLLRPSAKPFRK